jgi:anti-sigma28 factor (negative regulator of flagellin synthesis)
MEVRATGGLSGPEPIRPSRFSASGPKGPPDAGDDDDAIEVNEVSKFKALLKEVPAMRLEKIAALRAQIEAGTYETPEKIHALIDRLLEEL